MKKQFKNTFGIAGSPEQIFAFKGFAESLGWVKPESIPDWSSNHLYFAGVGDKLANNPNEYWHPAFVHTTESLTVYQLPAQWPEAIQAASEVVEEPRPTFERGQKVVSKDGVVMLCISANGCDYRSFEGVVIAENGTSQVGAYGKHFHKELFTLYTEPVTL